MSRLTSSSPNHPSLAAGVIPAYRILARHAHLSGTNSLAARLPGLHFPGFWINPANHLIV